MLCRKLIVIQGYKDGILDGPQELDFQYEHDDKHYNIAIEQLGIRMIMISSLEDCESHELYVVFCILERLCVLLDG